MKGTKLINKLLVDANDLFTLVQALKSCDSEEDFQDLVKEIENVKSDFTKVFTKVKKDGYDEL